MFSPEVKVYPLIDSPINDVKNWLLSYRGSVDKPPSILLGVIRLVMNKPRPWQCPWTSSKKRTKTENTAMSEQTKVGES